MAGGDPLHAGGRGKREALLRGRFRHPCDGTGQLTAPVLILTGPPGAGKTTIAEILAARSPRAAHVEADSFFRFIRSGYVEPWKPESDEQNCTVMRIVAEAARGYAAAGYFTIVEGILIPGWYLEPLRDALRAGGHEVACAVLRAPLEVCAARARDRRREPLGDPGVVERLWQSFAGPLGGLEPNAVDLGDSGPEAVADRLAEKLAAGLLPI